MEKILSVDQVAEVLGLTPFTIRKMFREGRLTGFKVGKAWRITQSGLEDELVRMQGGTPLPRPVAPPPVAAVSVPTVADAPTLPISTPAKLEPDIPAAHLGLPPRPTGSGRLILFSDVPTQEVYLDGQSKGYTTLSILDVREGEHRLQIGEARGIITIVRDSELRVTAEKGVFHHNTRGLARTGGVVNLRVEVVNKSNFNGNLAVYLTSEGGEANAEMFREYRSYLGADGLNLATALPPEGQATYFDGPVRTSPGGQLELYVPRQPGIDKEVRQAFSLEASLEVTIALGSGGLLRARPAVRILKGTAKGQ